MLRPCGTCTGIATLQLLRSKDLPLVPPALTEYSSNRMLSDLASGLSVADTVPFGQPVPPKPGRPSEMSLASCAWARLADSNTAANAIAVFTIIIDSFLSLG